MTANQINYWKNVETERSNRRNEAIKAHEADTKRMQYAWDKERDKYKLFFDAINAGTNFVSTTTQGYKNFASGTKELMQGASSLGGLFA